MPHLKAKILRCCRSIAAIGQCMLPRNIDSLAPIQLWLQSPSDSLLQSSGTPGEKRGAVARSMTVAEIQVAAYQAASEAT
jgi:hypothetical protein